MHCAVAALLALVAAGALAPRGVADGRVSSASADISCTSGGCHAEMAAAEHRHRPVEAGVCGICHRAVSVERHEFRLARSGNDLCAACHVDKTMAGNIHAGLGQGDCLICHDPHGTGNRFLLSAPRVVEACESCHFDLLAGRSDMHLIVAAESCAICHDPHDRGGAAALTGDRDLCLRCHVDVRIELETSAYAHAPAQVGQCDVCHDAHGPSGPLALRDEVPALCYGCHEAIRDAAETATHPHSVASGPGGCLVCHEPHASDLGYGLRADPFTLCGTCHGYDIPTPEGGVIPNVTSELAGAFLHGPVRQRDCGACHDSHGGTRFRLLVDEYPPAFYASFSVEKYGLCFGCHPERGILTEQTTQLTEFRDGGVNLHYTHVVKPENGRTCRACHATHGSDAPRHVREWVRFGEWEMPVGFEPTDTGGRCQSGCHSPRSYDRENPVRTRATDAPATDETSRPPEADPVPSR